MAERLDFIIFGASGFTGQATVIEAVRILSKYSWGIAGRNKSKLEDVLRKAGDKTGEDLSKIPIIIADVADNKSLESMAKSAKVVVNCCGPYRFYGEAVIKACIANSTHHVDVSGELQYVERMQLEHNEKAKEKGVYIISTCGFDSIPAEMGVVFVEQNFEGQINSIETYVEQNFKRRPKLGEAILNYGTWESAVYAVGYANEIKSIREQLFANKLPKLKPKLETKIILKSPKNRWSVPFPGPDKFVVDRSERFKYEVERKRPIQYMEYISFPSIFVLGVVLLIGAIFGLLSKCSCGRKLLLNYPRLFSLGQASHSGPSEETRKHSQMALTFYAKGWPKEEVLVEPTDQHINLPSETLVAKVSMYDPGYTATGTALLLSGKTILNESSQMPENGGVLPPGAAFAKTNLIKELSENGFKFEIISGGK